MAGEVGAGRGWGALWWDHVGHPGTGIPITRSVGTAHTLAPAAGSAGRTRAMGWALCRGHQNPALPPTSEASHGETWGKGSVVRARELRRVAGRAPAEITPPIFLLQELRDKRDLQDLPAIQIEYLILAAGEEWGSAPGARGGVRAVGPGAARGGSSSSQGKTDARAVTGGRWSWQPHAGVTGHSLPNLPLIPPAAYRLPTARHSLCCHVGAPAGPSLDEPRAWSQRQGCSGGA